jgi:hypothetical protein
MNTILGNDPAYSTSTSASVLLPTMQAIGGIFGRLDQVAPATISAAMATLTSYWNQVVADFQYGSTIGQVEAYIKAHPPADEAEAAAAVQQLTSYLTTTCHINISS